jgi:hypothetical protein
MSLNRALLTRTVSRWLPLAVAVTAVCLLVYVAVQQDYRLELNDPQIQLAEDAATRLARELVLPPAVVPATRVDIDESLAPWVVVYDEGAVPIAGNGYLGVEYARPPKGVFEHARRTGENRVTWQPTPSVRQAIVVVRLRRANGGEAFVVSGRNMREVEARIGELGLLTLAGWVTALVATFVTMLLVAGGEDQP